MVVVWSPREQGTGGVQETGDIRGGEGGEKYYLNYVPINVNALAGEGGRGECRQGVEI